MGLCAGICCSWLRVCRTAQKLLLQHQWRQAARRAWAAEAALQLEMLLAAEEERRSCCVPLAVPLMRAKGRRGMDVGSHKAAGAQSNREAQPRATARGATAGAGHRWRWSQWSHPQAMCNRAPAGEGLRMACRSVCVAHHVS